MTESSPPASPSLKPSQDHDLTEAGKIFTPPPNTTNITKSSTSVASHDNGRPIAIEVDYDGQVRRYRLRHGDHWDKLNLNTPWSYRNPEYGSLDWWNDWMKSGGEDMSFDDIVAEDRNRACLEKLVNLTPQTLPELATDWSGRDTRIPLFKDPESGDEYHIKLSESISLPSIECHSHGKKSEPFAGPLWLLQGRELPSQDQDTPRPPKHAIQLGSLTVRTIALRSREIFEEEEPVEEETDWNVVLDADDEDLPLWLVASRQQLKDHIIDAGPVDPVLPLRIFGGLMSDDDTDYDCAYLLDSVRRLGPDNPRAPAFSEICENIRKTRRITDPICSYLSKDQLDKYAVNEPFDHPEPLIWPADPNLEVKITALLPHQKPVIRSV